MALNGVEQSASASITSCEKANCSISPPICVLHLSEECCFNRETRRWHHLSFGEHCCDECLQKLLIKASSPNPQTVHWLAWQKRWLKHFSVLKVPPIQEYVANVFLPLWVECRQCHKWRPVPPSELDRHGRHLPTFANSFTCGYKSILRQKFPNPCDLPEDERVQATLLDPSNFLKSLTYEVYTQSSPAHAFLIYYPLDTVGIAPNASPLLQEEFVVAPRQEAIYNETQLNPGDFMSRLVKNPPRPNNVPCYFHPFLMPNEIGKYGAHSPAAMSESEMRAFPVFKKWPKMFLAVRNAMLALWHLFPRQWLSAAFVAPYIQVRGLARIVLVQHLLPDLLRLATFMGSVNCGLLPRDLPLDLAYLLRKKTSAGSGAKGEDLRVVVVGAGLTGMVASRHLATFGCRVTMLDACPGADEGRLGHVQLPVELGSRCLPVALHVVDACVNNPVTLLLHQAGIRCTSTPRSFSFLPSKEEQQPLNPRVLERANFHVQALLNHFTCLRGQQTSKLSDTDSQSPASFQDAFDEYERTVVAKVQDESYQDPLFSRVVEFHLSELDFVMGGGVPLSRISWDAWLRGSRGVAAKESPRSVVPCGASLEVNASVQDASFATLLSALDVSDPGEHSEEREQTLNIRLVRGARVDLVQYGQNEDVIVSTNEQGRYMADVVIMALPIHSFNDINFSPPMSEERMASLLRLSQNEVSFNHHITVTLAFHPSFKETLAISSSSESSPSTNCPAEGFFAGIPTSREERGFCHAFKFLCLEDAVVLQSSVHGEAIERWLTAQDGEVVTAVMEHLERLVPGMCHEPLWSHVYRWRQACTAPPVGTMPCDWVNFTQPPLGENKVFFVTPDLDRHFPTSVAASYECGIAVAQQVLKAFNCA